MLRALLLVPLAALSLSACATADLAGSAVGIGGLLLGQRPIVAAPPATISARELKSANKLAQTVFESLQVAFSNGTMPISTSPDTARPNFCKMVEADLAQILSGDAGGQASELTCRIEHELDGAKAALEAHTPDAASYTEHLGRADTLTDQLRQLIAHSRTGSPTK